MHIYIYIYIDIQRLKVTSKTESVMSVLTTYINFIFRFRGNHCNKKKNNFGGLFS